jgi:predicted AAA+ superfamily ATPase
MDVGALKQVIAEWLDGDPLPELVRRELAAPNLNQLTSVLAIVGPRRAGKTYYMYQLARDLIEARGCEREDILFVDFEDYRLLGFGPSDMSELLASFEQLAGRRPRFLFFDEVHRLPEWSRVLRTLHNQRRHRIVVSGGNSELLARETATELRGRYVDTLMLPFSFREKLEATGVRVSPRTFYTSRKGVLLAAFDDYLASGGFPEVVQLQTGPERRRLLQSYFNTVFYRDILERYNIRAKHVLDAMMSHCLGTYGDLFSVSRFEKHLKGSGLPGSKRTIANYLRYLQDASFVIVNEKFSSSPRKRIMNPKKLYLLDTGFSGLSAELSENRGKLLENVVATELLRREQTAYYYRGRRECDFVIVKRRRPVAAVQVCWELTSRNRDRELAGLVEAMNELGIRNGVILTHHEETTLTYSNGTVAVRPVCQWLLDR